MMLPTAIFFDLDDTIISFNGVAIPLWEEICETYCRQSGLFQTHQLFNAIQHSANWYWSDKERHRTGRLNLVSARRKVVKLAFQELGVDNIMDAYALADEFSTKRNDRLMVFPGAVETLEELNRRGVRLALLTNGDSKGQNYKIAKFNLRKYFERIFIEGEIGFGKPDKRVYRLALGSMELTPQEVWMVGDNLEWDVGAPQELGIYGIWNDHRKKGLPDSCDVVPDRIIHNISELVE
jgi:putative hydrolase of the HAD superfamily